MLLLIEAPADRCLLHLRKGDFVDGFAHHDRLNVGRGLVGVVWKTKWHCRVEGLEFPCHHIPFQSCWRLGDIRDIGGHAQSVMAQISNAFKIGAQF